MPPRYRIDEVHTLVGGGQTARGAGASIDIANLLKPPLARGALQCIAATTLGAPCFNVHSERRKLSRRSPPCRSLLAPPVPTYADFVWLVLVLFAE